MKEKVEQPNGHTSEENNPSILIRVEENHDTEVDTSPNTAHQPLISAPSTASHDQKSSKLSDDDSPHYDHHLNVPKNIYYQTDHHNDEHLTTTDGISTRDDYTEHSTYGHDTTTIHRIEEAAEHFANVTKAKSNQAIKLIAVSPFNILSEILKEEEREEVADLEEQVLSARSAKHVHSRTTSREEIPSKPTDEEGIKEEPLKRVSEETNNDELDVTFNAEENAEFTPRNPYNQEDSGKPLKFQTSFCLCNFEETPDFLRNNPFIKTHYRKYFSFKMCLKSIFKLHNETVNIWTHLLPIFAFFVLIFYTIYVVVGQHNTGANAQNILDMIIIIIYLGMAINCFFCSTMYHTVNCHSKKIWTIALRCDVSAISGLIGSSILPALYFNLYCYVVWQIVYISSISLFALVGMIFPCMPFKSPRALKVFGIVRTVLLLMMVLSALIPISHFLIFILPLKNEFTGSLYSDFNQDFIIGIVITVALYGIGLVFWLSKIPERFFPGRFDLFLSSHNIWHILITTASAVWYYYCLNLYVVKVEKLKAGLSCIGDGSSL